MELKRLHKVWAKVLKDPDAQRAFRKLATDGLDIRSLEPRDASLQHPNFADLISACPFLPKRFARREILRLGERRDYRQVVRSLRELAQKENDPFCCVAILSQGQPAPSDAEFRDLSAHLEKTADSLEKLMALKWAIRQRNPLHAVISNFRWEIRRRTGRPHDAEINIILDAAFRAAGFEKFEMDATTLERMEKREVEGRVRAVRRLRSSA